jgi:hypothetical protein
MKTLSLPWQSKTRWHPNLSSYLRMILKLEYGKVAGEYLGIPVIQECLYIFSLSVLNCWEEETQSAFVLLMGIKRLPVIAGLPV